MNTVQLLNTDFDGTLIEAGTLGECSDAFAAALDDHVRQGGFWAVNTGRSLQLTLEGLEHFRPPVSPDFLLTNERDIHCYSDEMGWVAHGSWNETCRRRHAELFREADKVFSFVHELARKNPHFTLLYENNLPAGLVARSEEVMEDIAAALEEAAAHCPEFTFQRNTIYLRFCHQDYHKGSALHELCRLEGLSPDGVLAAGDQLNDLSMLDGVYARMTACPANAIDVVKAAVRRSGGYVARANWADGVAEAMRFFGQRKRRDPAAGDPA